MSIGAVMAMIIYNRRMFKTSFSVMPHHICSDRSTFFSNPAIMKVYCKPKCLII